MESERWNRIEHLLQAVLEIDEEQRAEFLQQNCANDEDLRREVESLLVFRNDVEQFMETPAAKLGRRQLNVDKLRG